MGGTNRAAARARITDLSRRLRDYQHAYYILSQPVVPDVEYDRLFNELLALEAEYPDLVQPDSPSQRVGSDLTQELPEVAHTLPVLSLDKCYDHAELLSWIEKTTRNADRPLSFVCEQKIDGASIVLYYEAGLLARAVTRGNGTVGNDVTANVKTIGGVPLRLAAPSTVAVRGEIYLAKSLFASISGRMEAPYANPRNLASGTLRRVKSSEVARIPLDILVYEGFFDQPKETHRLVLEELESLGFKLNPHVGFFTDGPDLEEARGRHPQWKVGRIAELADFIESERARRSGLDYDIDGMVIKVNEMPAREALGFTGHHPRWEIAFKFEPPQGVTVVKAIEVQVGRTGRITPVARVEPVRISGSTISNVTLHNQEYVDMLELAVGDTVAVSKRGDVIPAVEKVVEKNDRGNTTWRIPSACPACGSALVAQGAHDFCANPSCPDQVRGRLAFFVARGQMDIVSLGPETIDALIRNCLARDIDELYSFDPEKLLALPGYGEKKVALIRRSLEESKKKPFSVVFPSLGIPEVGQKAAELLIGAGFTDIDSILSAVDGGDPEVFTRIHGIGERTAETLIQELSKPAMRRRIDNLRAAGLRFREEKTAVRADKPQIFAGQTWCVTGSFAVFKPREAAMAEVAARGGRTTATVTGKTTHLLAGSEPGSKLDRARELGVIIVTEEEFLRLLG